MLTTIGKMTLQDQNQYIFYASASSCIFVPLYIYLYGYYSTWIAIAVVVMWELLMFWVFAFEYLPILTNPLKFCGWYTLLLGSHNGIIAMLICYSCELGTTKARGVFTGLIAAATKLAGVFSPFCVTSIITNAGKAVGYQLAALVMVPLAVGGILFTIFSMEVSTYEADEGASLLGASPESKVEDVEDKL